MRTHRNLRLAALSLSSILVAAGIVFAQGQAERPDCPGKIVCPQTGDLVCRDKCPTIDPNRPDCPGRIICPLNGQRVCEDRCPLHASGTAVEAQRSKLPPCCAKKG